MTAAAAVLAAGGEVTVLALNEYEVPLYHGDLEDAKGLRANTVKLIEQIKGHDGLLAAAPECNLFITPRLKNTLDWCTRGEEDPFGGRAGSTRIQINGGHLRNQRLKTPAFGNPGLAITPGLLMFPS